MIKRFIKKLLGITALEAEINRLEQANDQLEMQRLSLVARCAALETAVKFGGERSRDIVSLLGPYVDRSTRTRWESDKYILTVWPQHGGVQLEAKPFQSTYIPTNGHHNLIPNSERSQQ